MTRTYAQTGFTLMELIVAVAIAGFVMLVFNQIFNQAAISVRRGVQTSDILSKARALDQQWAFDSELEMGNSPPGPPHSSTDPFILNPANWKSRMLGPQGRGGTAPGGILVIINHALPNVYLTLDDQLADRRTTVRSDQLLFILDQTPGLGGDQDFLPVLAPKDTQSFTGDHVNSLGDPHIPPPAGPIAVTEYVRLWYGHLRLLRANGADGEDLGDPTGGNPNLLAADWVLGRHALFLTGNNDTLGRLPAGIHATGFGPAAPIALIGGFLWQGKTDVSNWTLNDLTDTAAGPPTDPVPRPPGILNSLASSAAFRAFVFSPGGLAFNHERLRARADADLDDPGFDLTAEDLAPMHPYFAGGVSDFIVEFAHDYDNDANPNNNPPWPATGDGRVDRNLDGSIRWYSAYLNRTEPLGGNPDFPEAYVPPAPIDPPNNEAWSGGAGNGPYGIGAEFVWGPVSTQSEQRWPWLIRIRHRLHDRNGDFVGRTITINRGLANEREIQEKGRWFETIIQVNRQPL